MDELYGLPLDRFTPERNALARELRNGGERDRGAEVAALRKPSVAAWAVNQLVRTQKSAIGELFEAGDGLRHAHDEVLAGRGDGGSLRLAVDRERQAVESLIQSAGGLLSTDGHELSPTIIDRVADTLHAAALDDDARAQLAMAGSSASCATSDSAWRPPVARRRLRPPGGRPRPRLGRRPSRRTSARPRSPPPIEGRPSAPCENGRKPRRRPAREERALEREARRRLERAERGAELARERRDRAAQALEAAEAELAEAEDELREAKVAAQ